MKHIIFSILFTCCLFKFSFGQKLDPNKLHLWSADAYKMYTNKDYLAAANIYAALLKECKNRKIENDNIIDQAYNLACCWALANKPDSAFKVLNELATKDLFLPQYPHILTDNDLASLHNRPRWSTLISEIESHKATYENGVDKNLQAILDTIYNNDQQYRQSVARINKKLGPDSQESKDEWKKVLYNDSLNLIKIKDIIDKYGWLGPKKAGVRGSLAIYLVIQHADLKTQQKYYPLMEKAVLKGDARPSDLAFMRDRILLRRGKEQIYGSQLYTIKEKGGVTYPKRLADPENVDKRRFKVGLETMAEYLAPDKWDPIAYKKLYKQL